MNKQELISVVIPVYNGEKYVKKCLESILKQTYSNLEIIVVNDGSTDNTLTILERLSDMDHRVRILNQDNSGCVIARKNGVMNCSTESKYICFCDADDCMPVYAVDKLYQCCKQNNSEISIGSMDRMIKGRTIKNRFVPSCFQESQNTDNGITYSHNEFIEKLYCSWFGISNVPVNLCGKLFSTSLIIQVMANMPKVVDFFGEDLIVTLNCMPLASQITIIPDVVYHYRLGGGTTKYQPNMMKDWISLYRYKKSFALQYPMPQDIPYLMDVELCNTTFTYFQMCYKSKKIRNSEIEQMINDTCDLAEVKQAANHPSLVNNEKARLIREKDCKTIMSILSRQYYREIPKRIVKKVIIG